MTDDRQRLAPRKNRAVNRRPNPSADTAELRRQAEARLRQTQPHRKSPAGEPRSAADTRRMLHELQVHQVELEMQNVALREAGDRMEILLEKYTDLYDFAPVGYFSLDEQGRILDANLTAAGLLGVERSQLIHRRLPCLVAPGSRPVFADFLERVFSKAGKHVCEAALLRADAAPFWASVHATSALSLAGLPRWCRVAVSDITSLKQAEEALRRVEALAALNRELTQEIARRQAVEESLRKSEQHQVHLFEQSRRMHEELRHLSRRILRVQEEERKRISRELHDVVAQTLTAINVRLATLKKDATLHPKGLDRNITRTQELVAHSVNIVHRFARELRPSVLDDLGLIPALRTFIQHYTAETGIRVSLSALPVIAGLDDDKRIVLYRVAQEALTNVARHANASRVKVEIQNLDGAVCMTIHDNGDGFQEKRVAKAKTNQRLGLLGMRERLEMVGGSLTVTSAPGKGATVQANIPAKARSEGPKPPRAPPPGAQAD
jgi:PAS domain S-box-containing protein